jgi:hypothetical protein
VSAIDARDAVAELIAADKEYDAAQSAIEHGCIHGIEASYERLATAKTRRAAALARFKEPQSP